jgi:WD40 repeat protein
VNTHVPPVKPNENIPKPFNQIHSVPLEDRQSIYAAIRKLILTPRSSLSWTAGGGKVVRTIDTQSKSVIMALLMGPDPEKIFSVTYNGEIGIWGTLTGRSLLAKDSALAGTLFSPLLPGSYPAISPDGTYIVHRGRLFDVSTGKEVSWIPKKGSSGSHLDVCTFSPDGKWLLRGDRDEGRIVAYKMTAKKTFQKEHDWDCGYAPRSLAFSPNGMWLASADHSELFNGYHCSKTVKIWDVRTGELRRELPVRTLAVAWSPDGKSMFGSSDLSVWSAETGRRIFCVGYTGDFINLFSSTYLRRYIGEETLGEKVMKAWQTPNDGFGPVTSFAPVSPDGTRLVGSDGISIVVLDARTGALLSCFEDRPRSRAQRNIRNVGPSPRSVNSVLFSPDGLHILTAEHFNGRNEIKILSPDG